MRAMDPLTLKGLNRGPTWNSYYWIKGKGKKRYEYLYKWLVLIRRIQGDMKVW